MVAMPNGNLILVGNGFVVFSLDLAYNSNFTLTNSVDKTQKEMQFPLINAHLISIALLKYR